MTATEIKREIRSYPKTVLVDVLTRLIDEVSFLQPTGLRILRVRAYANALITMRTIRPKLRRMKPRLDAMKHHTARRRKRVQEWNRLVDSFNASAKIYKRVRELEPNVFSNTVAPVEEMKGTPE